MTRLSLAALALSTLLIGCANVSIEARHSSKPDPQFSFSHKLKIAFVADEKQNALESKFYLRQAVAALRDRGFESVVQYGSPREIPESVDIVAFLTVDTSFSTYQYNEPQLGRVSTGSSTINCNTYVDNVNCSQTQDTKLGVTGYIQSTGTSQMRSLTMQWYRRADQQKVLFSFAATFDTRCSSRALYEFLVAQTITRIDFAEPKEYKYTVHMPKGYSCRQ